MQHPGYIVCFYYQKRYCETARAVLPRVSAPRHISFSGKKYDATGVYAIQSGKTIAYIILYACGSGENRQNTVFSVAHPGYSYGSCF